MEKKQKRILIAIVAIALIASLIVLSSTGSTNGLPVGDGPTTNLPPFATPTPAPVQTSSPTSGTGGTFTASAQVWQTLHISNTLGGSYWYNAPSPFTLQNIYGSQSGDQNDFKQVILIDNTIQMKITSPVPTLQIQSYSFTCQESIEIKDHTNKLVSSIADHASVSGTSTNVPLNQNIQVAGVTLRSVDIQNLMSGVPVSQTMDDYYYFTITLYNIELTLNLTNGQVLQYSTPVGSASNVLQWKIIIT